MTIKITPSFEVNECCPDESDESCLYYNVRLFFEMENISVTLEFDQDVDWERLYLDDETEYQEGQLRGQGQKKFKKQSEPNFSITKKNGKFEFWLPTNFVSSDSVASTTLSIPASIFLPQIKNILDFEASHKSTGDGECLVCDVCEKDSTLPEKVQ